MKQQAFRFLRTAFGAVLIVTASQCTDSPTMAPETTSAKANQQQAEELKGIRTELKRIADALEKK